MEGVRSIKEESHSDCEKLDCANDIKEEAIKAEIYDEESLMLGDENLREWAETEEKEVKKEFNHISCKKSQYEEDEYESDSLSASEPGFEVQKRQSVPATKSSQQLIDILACKKDRKSVE